MPIGGRSSGGLNLAEKIVSLKQQAEESGRDPSTISITVFGAQPDADEIQHLESIGVSRAVLSLPSEEKDTVLPMIDEYAKLI